jgi:hypothetical protein
MPKKDKRIEKERIRMEKGATERFEYIYIWKKVGRVRFQEDAKGCGVAKE